jgi:hypothetical protein
MRLFVSAGEHSVAESSELVAESVPELSVG